MRATSIRAAADKRARERIQISLVTPYKHTPDNDLDRLMTSLEETTEDPMAVETIIIIDKCDKDLCKRSGELEYKYRRQNLRIYAVDQSDHFSKDYFNYAAKMANGRWIMAINDDSIFKTKGWDQIVIEKMGVKANDVGDDILFGIVDDGMIVRGQEKVRRTFSCWPMLSKEYCDLMDGILIEAVYTWGGDFWLGQVFSHVKNGTRLVHMPEVFIFHNSHHNQSNERPQGASFALFQRIEKENPTTFNGHAAKMMGYKINDYIKGKK